MRFNPSLKNSKSVTPNLVNKNNSVKLKANDNNKLNAHDATAKVMFLHESLEGHKDNKLKFTDLLPEKIYCEKIEAAFNPVISDKQLLTHEKKIINLNYDNGNRAKSIFKLVLSDEIINNYWIYEVDINDHKLV
ncbi:hypothetical protein [Fructilactobacillus florum]|uniref:hypothetical protein n=1 Tax=Fructilactobacillus florum TaxID=640331 RepID=UPI0006D03C7F|nr:hypothetical protein [Fructilactobacillus florum]